MAAAIEPENTYQIPSIFRNPIRTKDHAFFRPSTSGEQRAHLKPINPRLRDDVRTFLVRAPFLCRARARASPALAFLLPQRWVMHAQEPITTTRHAKAAREAELDAEEMRDAELAEEGDDGDEFADADDAEDDDETEGEGEEPLELPTAEEREEEKKTGGPQVHVVQRRMRECVRVLGNFKKRAAAGRCVTRSVAPMPQLT